ncbi:hypothetical protein MRX96_049981 [Rhipicephalus microplus]
MTALQLKGLLDSEPFRQLLEAMELRVCSTQRALPQDFQTCLTYTMVALLAPAWNKVGRYLCQGRDFLVADDVIPAIDWQILATETKTELTLCAVGIRLRHMTLVDLLRTSQISQDILVRLLENEVAIEPMECFVLPSMKIATATAVSFKLFSDCPFRSFKDLKKFWKKTEHTPINSDLLVQYGYRLPCKTEPRITFVKVRFQTRQDRTYVYPILCVRPTEAQPLAPINPDPIIGSFLQCVKLRMGQLYGEPFSMVSRSPAFPNPQMYWTDKDTRTGIVSWTTRPSCQDPYSSQVPIEAPKVTVFIGDSEVVSECDDEVQKTQQNSLPSLTKLKPSFQPKQSHVHHHHSQVSACSRAQPPNEPGSSRDQVGDHLPSPQVRMNTSGAAFPAVVEWLNSCVSPVVQKPNSEITTRKTVSFTEVRQAIRTDVMSYKTETRTPAGTARSQKTLQGQQAGWAALNAHNTRCVSEGKTSEDARSKPTNLVTVAHLREKTSSQLGASAPAQTVHYASSGEAARNAVPGHTKVVLQAQKASAQFADKPGSFSAPAQNISDASRCGNHGNAKDGILAQAKTAMRQGDPSTQLGKLMGVSSTPAQDMRDFEQRNPSPSSGGRQLKKAKTDQSAENTSSMLLEGEWNEEIYILPHTPPDANARKLSKNVLKGEWNEEIYILPHTPPGDIARKLSKNVLEGEWNEEIYILPHTPPDVNARKLSKNVLEEEWNEEIYILPHTPPEENARKLSKNVLEGEWNEEIYILPHTPPGDNARKPSKNAEAARKPQFEEHRQAVKPYLRHAVKQVRETLPPNKANNQQIITFNHPSASHPRPTPPIKHKAYQSEKNYQKEEASYSCVTNVLVDENATDREIAWQPVQSTPREADDLSPLMQHTTAGSPKSGNTCAAAAHVKLPLLIEN